MSGKAAPEIRASMEHGPVRTWSVYLLSCADGTLYCGVTTDVHKRLAMHNGQRSGGARYTRGRRPVRLAACAGGMTRSEALRLEARIKKEPRERKTAVLEAFSTDGAGERASESERDGKTEQSRNAEVPSATVPERKA
ncbi:GIY-YIG nuclease family protein [Mailhella sp.]|uniref:GIY-YIG nuclease family protein n=1 Tax=Mailhella sp. TaxID=1981029 RepID=UPI00406358AB